MPVKEYKRRAVDTEARVTQLERRPDQAASPCVKFDNLALSWVRALMIYVKSLLAGVAALAVSALVAMLMVLWPVMQMSGNWHQAISLTALGAVTDSTAALLIFGAGFYWEFRRLSKRQSLPNGATTP